MLSGRHIVLIEDDPIMGNSILQRLELEGAEVTWIKLTVRGVAAVRTPRRPVDAVVCDIRLPDGTGEDVFTAVSRSITPPPFLFITGQGEIDQAVRLLRAGASDYMTKPFEMSTFLKRLVLILRSDSPEGLPPRTGITPVARHVDALVAEFARSDHPVLIRGQMGLGKARLARQVHDLSDRRAAPFVTINALRDDVAENELFEALSAVGEGTLFVNGVGRLAPSSQDCLMDALTSAAPFRLIASVGTQIEEKVADGGFRQDLLYALVSNEIVVPPFSQRVEDAVWLAGQLFDALNRRRATPLKGLSALAEGAIRDHDWPGNGRELRARIARAVDTAEGEWIFPSALFPELGDESRSIEPLSEARDAAERRQILKALSQTGGQMAEAARLLRVSRTTLWEKMQKLGL
ncbi:MAG: response regulator [Paracoccaceae bacterium]|nr:response regulator [Paracoccaceae bacterium]